jgi:hypothetical protein
LSQDLKENRSNGASDEAIQASNHQARGAFVIYKPDNLQSTSIQRTAASAGAGNDFPKMLVNNVRSVDIVPGKLLMWRNSFFRQRHC